MGDEIYTTTDELVAQYNIFGTTGWEELEVWDSAGRLWRRDFHAETGLSDTLVRIRWGGARHKDRYRWATWAGRLTVAGSSVDAVTPWAATHPEQEFLALSNEISWRTTTYGSDIGVIVSLADLASAHLQIESSVVEDDLDASVVISGADLIEDGRSETVVGGLNLTLIVERIADLADLPVTATGQLTVDLPPADSALYLRARQADGHQVWTSPLFVSRSVG